MSSVRYQIVPGFFIQDTKQDNEPIGPTPPFFGLISGSWSLFRTSIERLNGQGPPRKVLFLGRHGQGWHNVAEAKYRTKSWDEKWALLDGDGEIIWGPDPLLTALGEEQAVQAHDAWKREIDVGAPIPTRFICSPMHRALRTYEISWGDIVSAKEVPPLILENAREHYGEHTCDKRRTRSEIARDFPNHVFEDGFAEEDVLWTHERETYDHIDERAKALLDTIFTNYTDHTYISITGHSGIFNGIFRVIGRGNYPLPTGGIFVAVVQQLQEM
ncbi:phosphoglycerate mutase [Vararia minispora EC-137]|uniref:Phosphoglycerate mutase n=1 Tax=Vararia minispora EC-137 TaxID=1314806 RepID=A0ACB8QSY0_9AGAM|nr:phosphoglycerate mutase [Vararia minispora EC-137]